MGAVPTGSAVIADSLPERDGVPVVTVRKWPAAALDYSAIVELWARETIRETAS